MLTNVATALFGLADLWVIGQLGEAEPQAGVELGAKFMMGLLIVFNFLRTGTIALTAQAAGRGDEAAQAATLARALGVALAIGLVLLALKPLAMPWGLELLHARGGVAAGGRRSMSGSAIGAACSGWPTSALMGWLIGRRRVRAVLVDRDRRQSRPHRASTSLFVLGFGWGVAGVAAATLLSEGGKTLALLRSPRARGRRAAALALAARPRDLERGRAWAPCFRLNRDLFLRTLLLTAAILLLTRQGAQQGPLVLAANGILYQLFILSALILDGFESAAQVLCGEAVGAKDRAPLRRPGAGAAALGPGRRGAVQPRLCRRRRTLRGQLQHRSGGGGDDPRLRALGGAAAGARSHLLRLRRNLYRRDLDPGDAADHGAPPARVYGALLLVTGPLGNHGLWLAFSLFLVARAAGQALMLPRLARIRRSPDPPRHGARRS